MNENERAQYIDAIETLADKCEVERYLAWGDPDDTDAVIFDDDIGLDI